MVEAAKKSNDKKSFHSLKRVSDEMLTICQSILKECKTKEEVKAALQLLEKFYVDLEKYNDNKKKRGDMLYECRKFNQFLQ